MSGKVNPLDHIGLVRAISRRYHRTKEPLEDSEVYAAALLGLLKACAYFDPGRGTKFSTIAWKGMWFEIDRERQAGRRQRRVRDGNLLTYEPIASESEAEQLRHFSEVQKLLNRAIKQLPEQQRVLIKFRLQGHTHQKCGELMGVTTQRAQQIHSSATANLREILCQQL